MPYITIQEDVYISAQEWFDDADENDIKEMFDLCKGHLQDTVGVVSSTIQEAEFQAKLRNLQDRYLSLTTEQLNLILNI